MNPLAMPTVKVIATVASSHHVRNFPSYRGGGCSGKRSNDEDTLKNIIYTTISGALFPEIVYIVVRFIPIGNASDFYSTFLRRPL